MTGRSVTSDQNASATARSFTSITWHRSLKCLAHLLDIETGVAAPTPATVVHTGPKTISSPPARVRVLGNRRGSRTRNRQRARSTSPDRPAVVPSRPEIMSGAWNADHRRSKAQADFWNLTGSPVSAGRSTRTPSPSPRASAGRRRRSPPGSSSATRRPRFQRPRATRACKCSPIACAFRSTRTAA